MRIFLVLFSCCLAISVTGQDVVQEMKRLNKRKILSLDSSGWKKSGNFILEINQAHLNNWPSGGERFLFGINSMIDYAAHHRMGKFAFDGYLDFELGFVEAASFNTFRKTTDRFDITAEVEHTMGKKTYYGILTNFNTQLFPGHNYFLPGHDKISSFLSPGKLIVSPGFDFKDYDRHFYISVFASPLTVRWVIKRDPDFRHTAKFGVDSSERFLTELGPYISVHLNELFSSTVKYTGRLDLFSNYRHQPQNVDILFHNLISFSISKFFSANIMLDIIYDHDIIQRTQVQQTFGMGLKLKL